MEYKISPLIISPKSKKNSTVDVYVAQPDKYQEKLAGKIFVIIEIESTRSDDVKIINFVIENFYHNYYQNEKIILREKSKSIKTEHIFESSIAKINKNLLDFLHSEKIKFNPNLLNATIGVVCNNEIHFSNVGKNKSLLIYKNTGQANEKEKTKYQISDIIEHARNKDGQKKQINLAKLFSNVISGKIPKNGYFIFTNEALPEFLSNKQLVEIITTLDPDESIEKIKQTLSSINNYVSFLAIIIEHGQEIPQQISQTKNSITELNTLEYSTEDTLSTKSRINLPELIKIIKQIPSKIISLIKSKKKSKKNLIPLSIKDKISFQRRSHGFSFGKLFLYFRDFILFVINFLIFILQKITSIYSDQQKEQKSSNKFENEFARPELNQQIAFNKKNINKNNILSVIILIGVILILFNTIFINKENKTEKIVEINTDLINQINQKQNQIEANLLYGNETNAKKILEEVKTLLNEVAPENENKDPIYIELWAKYNTQIDRVKHIVDANGLKLNEIADFSITDSDANLVNIVFVNNKIYSADRQQKKIYELNLSNSEINIINLSQEIDAFKYPILDNNNNIYYLDDSKNVTKLDTDTNVIKNLSINLSGSIDDIGGGAGYNSRLYYINKANNQIFRYAPDKNGFPTAHRWLNEDINLKNAADIEIDGYIYVLLGNGDVLKLLKGRQESFELDKIEPRLKFATKLFVSPELDYIYILDVIEKRLIVYNKNGKFILQYQSNQFTELKDFTINEENKIIYFLNGSKIMEVEGVHFK